MAEKTNPSPEHPPVESTFTFPPIAGFWRRFAAWFLDVLLLGIVGQIIGLAFSSFWFSIGPYGRFVGFVVIPAYFGLMNSKFGGGQTIGKRLLKIAVRNGTNQAIEIPRSFARILILATPGLVNGWQLPIVKNPIIAALFAVILFGVGGAILYTMLFNRRTRQGFHDLVCGTYVVHLPGRRIEFLPVASRVHWVVSGLLIALAGILVIAGIVFTPIIKKQPILVGPLKLYEILRQDERWFSAGVQDKTILSSAGPTRHVLDIQVWLKGKPSEAERDVIIADLVKTVLENTPNLERYDGLRISITSAYDLGIASAHISYSRANSISGWSEEIR